MIRVSPKVGDALRVLRSAPDAKTRFSTADLDEAHIVHIWDETRYWAERHSYELAFWLDTNPMGIFFVAMQDGFEIDEKMKEDWP